MQYQIRAMRVGEILDTGINLVKNHFGLLFGIMAVSVIPMQIIAALVQLSVIGDPQALAMRGQVPMEAVIIMLVLGLISGLVVAPLANAASIYAISSAYLSRPVTIGEAFRHAVSRWPALLGTSILMGLTIVGPFLVVFLLGAFMAAPPLFLLSFILLLIPGVLPFLFWFALSQHVAVLENRSGTGALGRSKDLMGGNFLALFVIGLVVTVIAFGFLMLGAFIPQPHLNAIVNAILQGVLGVFFAACWVVFYFSCRCKFENFDLHVLAASVEEG